jgi:hypothetical protein
MTTVHDEPGNVTGRRNNITYKLLQRETLDMKLCQGAVDIAYNWSLLECSRVL